MALKHIQNTFLMMAKNFLHGKAIHLNEKYLQMQCR